MKDTVAVGLAPTDVAAGRAPAGVYVHLPFCDRICPYCDFAVVEHQRVRVERYLRALHAEIDRAPQPRHPVSTIYLGGGTPSALTAEQIGRVLDALFGKFAVEPGRIECTLEANPSRNAADLPAYRKFGVTRLSVGVQSFDDAELHRLGRAHSAQTAADFVIAARAAGHADINLDLIAGVPGQTVKTLEATLRRALDLAPDHMSVYALTIENGTPYAAWHRRDPGAFPDDDAVAILLQKAHAMLTAAGYEHYEISNFAKPGRACRHNLGYWQQRDCVAFGMSAAGYEDGVRYQNLRNFDDYCSTVESCRSPREQVERLDFAARVGEAAMLALRTRAGIVGADFIRRFGVDARAAFAGPTKKCSEAGLLEVDDVGVRLTARGRLLANTVCAEFLTPEL